MTEFNDIDKQTQKILDETLELKKTINKFHKVLNSQQIVMDKMMRLIEVHDKVLKELTKHGECQS